MASPPMLSQATRPHRACAPWAAIYLFHSPSSPIRKVEPNPQAKHFGIRHLKESTTWNRVNVSLPKRRRKL